MEGAGRACPHSAIKMSTKPVLGVAVAPDHPAPPQAAPGGHDAQSTPTPPRSAPEAPPPAFATPPQVAPDGPPPASATLPQAVPHVPSPEPATPPKAVAGLYYAEPPPPPPKVVGLGAQAPPPKAVASVRPLEVQPVQSIPGNAQRVPVSEPVKREYLAAVKTHKQQVGPNIVRGKMFVESFPTIPRDMPAERRFSPLPGTGYGPDIDMGPGRDYMYAPMSNGHDRPMDKVAPPNVQRSREDFVNLALGHNVNLGKMAEMGPEVRRLLDMGSRVDQILHVPDMPHAGRRPSGYADPTGPIMLESYERPPHPGCGAPVGRYSAEACPRGPRLYGAQEPLMGGRLSYEGPNYARWPCSRERTAYVGENRPTRRSMSRASDLLDRIRQAIDEHRAKNIVERIRGDAASLGYGKPDVRVRPRRSSMPHDSRPPSRNVQRASYDDDGRSDRRAHSRLRRQRSRHLKKSSSSSSSSSSVGRPRNGRSKRSKESKGKTSCRRSKKSPSSSFSSSGSRSKSKSKSKGRSTKFVRKVTVRFSSSSTGPEMELNDPPQLQQSNKMNLVPLSAAH